MKNIYFPEEEISKDDLYFVCSMIERTARKINQPNRYVVERMGKRGLVDKLSVANVLHSENPEAVAQQWIEEYGLECGGFDVSQVNPDLAARIPTVLQMGKVYARLVLSTLTHEEDYADGILRIYHSPICRTIDNYNSSAYYEPSYFITRAYYQGNFN
ncbi:MAG: hypothetical protein Q4D56_02765 [Bacteroides sp.]|nr:hypothetical protein [Bacteroides sp.]